MLKSTIFIVEDDASIADIIDVSLQHFGHTVCGIADSADGALAQVSTIRPDLVLMDIEIKGSLSGIELAQKLRTELSVPVVFMTAHADSATVKKAVATEPFGYLVKPVNPAVLEATIQTAIGRVRTEKKLSRTELTLEGALNSIDEAVLVLDGNYRLAFMNKVAERLTSWTRAAAQDVAIAEVLVLSAREGEHALMDLLEGALTQKVTSQAVPRRLELASSAGSSVVVYATASPIRGRNGRASGVAIVLREELSESEAARSRNAVRGNSL
jgi:PAS domain S-box-containing protein